MREWFARLTDWFRRDRLDKELVEELRFHRDRLNQDVQHAGASNEDAKYIARQRIGSELRVREDARERWSLPMLDQVRQDLRYALRGIKRSPGFAATVVLTLGLGIGANAAMFGVIDQLMFRPFPYLRDASQVHRVYLQTTARGKVVTRSEFQYTRYLDLKRESHLFEQYAGYAERELALGSGDDVRERMVAGASASLFEFFDARPQLGRFFVQSEDKTPTGDMVAVLGHAYWKTHYAERNVVGERLQVGNANYTIIGVAPADFVGVSEGAAPVVFIPITTFAIAAGENKANTYFYEYNWDWMSVIVRRRDGVSEAAANADLTNALRLSRAGQRAKSPLVTADSIAKPRAIAGSAKTAAGPNAGLESATLVWVGGVAIIVLLIACANVTNLMFARVLRRRREVAVRLALGISRRRLVAQFLTESVLLALVGCVAGLAVVQWGGAALRQLVARNGATLNAATDWPTFGAACALAIMAGLLTGIGPAFLAGRGDLAATLRAGVREGTYQRSRIRTGLLVAQSAMSVVLLIGAGLFVQSLHKVQSMHMGFDADQVLMVSPVYRGLTFDSATRATLQQRLLQETQQIPGIQYAARINSRPFGTNTTSLFVPGIDSVQRLGRFNFQMSTVDYFKVMGTRIVQGRSFTEGDRLGSMPVAIVSDAMARAVWPGKDPIGQCMRVSFESASYQPLFDRQSLPCTTVIGVAEDVVQQSMTDDQHLMYYLPLEQFSMSGGRQIFARVASRDAALLAEQVRNTIQRSMPGQSYVTVELLEDLVDKQRRSWRLGATMFVAFGVLALTVAAVGLYGVIAYNVAQRMHELGVRVALGARTADVVRLVVSQGITFAFAGVLIGAVAARAAAHWLQPLLFQQSATDPLTYFGVAAAILLVALAACAIPASRASKVDPNSALRSD